MSNLNINGLKKQIDKLWSEGRKGQRKAIDLIHASYGQRSFAWGMQYTKLAPVSKVTDYLTHALIETSASDDTRNAYLINKLKVNTSNAATPILDVSRGMDKSRFIDAADLFDMIDNIESYGAVFIDGEAVTF